jgi:hypothetical protein
MFFLRRAALRNVCALSGFGRAGMADGRWQIYGNYTFYGFYVKQKAEIGKAETTPHVVAYNEKG